MKNILGCYLMPHPPLIIPEIGKGSEKKLEKTTIACNQIAKEISTFKPETIIIITPHSTIFSDYITISHGDEISGSFHLFDCSEISMKASIDKEFNDELNLNSTKEGIQTILADSNLLYKYNNLFELDYGTMVPLYFINKYYTNYKLIHITCSMIDKSNLYKFGIQIQKTAKSLNRKCVIIASGDLSHRLKNIKHNPYSRSGKIFDNICIKTLESGNVLSLFNISEPLIEKANQCALNSIFILIGCMNGNNFNGNCLSYEWPFGVGYCVMKFTFCNSNTNL